MYHDDSDDALNLDTLTLVNRHHPVTARKTAAKARQTEQQQSRIARTKGILPEGCTRSSLENSQSTSAQQSRLLNLPHDLLFHILAFLHPDSIARVSMTCRSAYSSLVLQKALFQMAFSPAYVPVETYKDYKLSGQMALYTRLINMLENGLGPEITHMTIYEFLSVPNLLKIAWCCPNLTSLDCATVMEPVDFTRFRRYLIGCCHGKRGSEKEDIPAHERLSLQSIYDPKSFDPDPEHQMQRYLHSQSKCYACRDRFQWPIVLCYCPRLFSNLRSIRVMYEGHLIERRRGSDTGKLHLSYLLKLMPNLQKLAFDCWRNQEEKTAKNDFTWYQCTRKECQRLVGDIVAHASRELRVLELNSAIELVEDVTVFTKALEALPKLRTLIISIYHDLKRRSAWTWRTRGRHFDDPLNDRQDPLGPGNDYAIQYVAGLREAISRGWNVRTVNRVDEYYVQAKPWRYFSFLREDCIENLRWLLRSDMDWNPVWKWNSYMYRCHRRSGDRPRRHDPDIVADAPQLRKLFEEIKKANKPIRIRLSVPAGRLGFFLRKHRLAQADIEVLSSRLDLVGDLIDNIELLYSDECFARGTNYREITHPRSLTPEEATDRVMASLRDTLRRAEEKLKNEARTMSAFVRYLKDWCPNLRRLSFVMPSPLYADSDRLFIERVLPGKANEWTVRHKLTDFEPSRYQRVREEETEGWGCDSESDNEDRETEQQVNFRRKITWQQCCDKILQMEQERCPNLERVFERRVDAKGRPLVGLPSIDEEWNTTKRPLGIGVFDMTDFERFPPRTDGNPWH